MERETKIMEMAESWLKRASNKKYEAKEHHGEINCQPSQKKTIQKLDYST